MIPTLQQLQVARDKQATGHSFRARQGALGAQGSQNHLRAKHHRAKGDVVGGQFDFCTQAGPRQREQVHSHAGHLHSHILPPGTHALEWPAGGQRGKSGCCSLLRQPGPAITAGPVGAERRCCWCQWIHVSGVSPVNQPGTAARYPTETRPGRSSRNSCTHESGASLSTVLAGGY